MNWTKYVNHSDNQLSNKTMFGGIRRDAVRRKAQIAVYRKTGTATEWVDLIDYRYGMDAAEIEQDIQASGISAAEWKANMAVLCSSKHYNKPMHFNGERIYA